MYRTNTARRLTFATPAVGATALLPQQAAAGTMARIKQTAPGYFNVAVQAITGGELRYYVVRWHEARKQWIVTAPAQLKSGRTVGGYDLMQAFRNDHQRDALEYAVRYLTVDWVNEVGNAA
jgi:hypothetical protein